MWQYRLRLMEIRERFVTALVWRLPRWLVYWCTIRLWARASMGEYSQVEAPAITIDQALKAWGDA